MQLTITHINSNFDCEPRIRDTDLAEWLGLERATNIRTTIAGHYDELSAHGNMIIAKTPQGRGRPSSVYWLNQAQALVLCSLCRTPKATEVRQALVKVFTDYQQGKLVPVKAHNRRPPSPRIDDYESHLAFLKSFRNDPDALFSLMAGMLTRLDMLENRSR